MNDHYVIDTPNAWGTVFAYGPGDTRGRAFPTLDAARRHVASARAHYPRPVRDLNVQDPATAPRVSLRKPGWITAAGRIGNTAPHLPGPSFPVIGGDVEESARNLAELSRNDGRALANMFAG